MVVKSWLNSLRRNLGVTTKSPERRSLRGRKGKLEKAKLKIERLEDRTVPALSITAVNLTGASAISADLAKNSSTPTWTLLDTGGNTGHASIQIAESGNYKKDFAPNQTNATLVFTAPSGWEFNPGQGTVSFSPNGDISSASVSVTSTSISITFSTGNGAKTDTLDINGIQVRATDGSAIPSTGHIYRKTGAGGNALLTDSGG